MSARFCGYVGTSSKELSGRFENRLRKLPRSPQNKIIFKNLISKATLLWAGKNRDQVISTDDFDFVLDGHIYSEPRNLKQIVPILLEKFKGGDFESGLQAWTGEFSFACYDKKNSFLYLVRDRIGVKPLYYYLNPDRKILTFGSQPDLLFGSPGFDFSVNKAFVGLFAGSHYRTIDNNRSSSPYSQIHQLMAGHILIWTPEGIIEIPYWSLKECPPSSKNFETTAEDYRELLKKAVGVRVNNSNKPAFTLSGGLDSSSVLSCASLVTGQKQVAYSSVYDDPTFDESSEIKSMLGGEHVLSWNPIPIEPRHLFDLIAEMVEIHSEPVATATWLSHYLLCDRVLKDDFDTLFGGLGGDELNAGEYEYFFYFFADLKKWGKDDLLKREIENWASNHDHPVFKKNFDVASRGWLLLTDQERPGACLPDRARINRYAKAINQDYFDVGGFVPVMDRPFQSYFKNRAVQDLLRETMPCCLRAEDRHSAYYGLENLLPFLDHRVVEFMFSVPPTWQIQDGVTKILLREAMKGILPEETRTRIKKTGWNAPAHIWFSNEFFDSLSELINSSLFKERGIYNQNVVESLLKEHRDLVQTGASKDNHMMFFWQLVNLEIWLRWVDKQRKQSLKYD